MRRYWVEDVKGWQGFTYLILRGVPMKHSKIGGVIDYDMRRIEKLVACAILERQVPIRGHELAFLRRTLRLSCEKFARRLGISYGAIFAWEKKKNVQLSIMAEIAVRLFCAEELVINLSGNFTSLIGDRHHDLVEVEVTKRQPTPKERKTKTIYKPSYRGFRKVEVRDED